MELQRIDLKSIGMLFDELYTAEIKAQKGMPGAAERVVALNEAIDFRRAIFHDLTDTISLEATLRQLKTCLGACWTYQEIVMREQDVISVAEAAKLAQKENAKRNKLIRQIDQIVGDDDRAPLGKSYD